AVFRLSRIESRASLIDRKTPASSSCGRTNWLRNRTYRTAVTATRRRIAARLVARGSRRAGESVVAATSGLLGARDRGEDLGAVDDPDERTVIDDADRLLGRGGGMDGRPDHRVRRELRPVEGVVGAPVAHDPAEG